MERPVIVSACLIGLRTRYDGTDALSHDALSIIKGRPFIPVCPEVLGGLPTPRPRAEIEAGDGIGVIGKRSRVIDEDGRDVTVSLLRGAQEVLKIVRLSGSVEAILKEKSPSCGVEFIKRKGETIRGAGILSALLKKEGIKVRGLR